MSLNLVKKKLHPFLLKEFLQQYSSNCLMTQIFHIDFWVSAYPTCCGISVFIGIFDDFFCCLFSIEFFPSSTSFLHMFIFQMLNSIHCILRPPRDLAYLCSGHVAVL